MSRILVPIGHDSADYFSVEGDENNVIVQRYVEDLESKVAGKFNVEEWVLSWPEWVTLREAIHKTAKLINGQK